MFTKRVAAMWAVWLVAALVVWTGSSSLASDYPGTWELVATFSLQPIIWLWWWLDAQHEGHPRPPTLGTAILLVPPFAVPFYLFTYKGWKRSLLSLLKFLAFLIVFAVYFLLVVMLRSGGH